VGIHFKKVAILLLKAQYLEETAILFNFKRSRSLKKQRKKKKKMRMRKVMMKKMRNCLKILKKKLKEMRTEISYSTNRLDFF